MRLVGLNLAAFLAAVALLIGADIRLVAQPPGAPAAQPPAADPKLDGHLDAWGKQMGGLTNFHAKFNLTRKPGAGAAFQNARSYKGSILVMKPMYARLRLDSTTNKDDYEAFICNGKSLYAYSGLDKTITEFPLSGNEAGGSNLMLDIVRGMTAQQAKQRFQIALFKEDPNYIYLDIKPTTGADQQEFLQLRLALYGPNVKAPGAVPYMPAQVWKMSPNQDTEVWEFTDLQTNIPGIEPKVFDYQAIPGWQTKKWQPPPPMGAGPPPAPGK